MNIGIADKILTDWIDEKEYITASDEAECVAIAGGYFMATGKKANVFMSSDGFMNTLNFITSWVIPDGIEMNIIISFGRKESQHYIASEMLLGIVEKLIEYDKSKGISFQFITK